MKQAYRLIALLSLAALLSACGGGSGDSSASAASHTFSSSSANVVAISVAPGPASADYQTFNIPLVTVTVCEPGGSTCASIPDVLVDSGSSGLRLVKSVLTGAGITLTPMADPANSSNTIAECLPFADGSSWGPVATATVQIGGESTTAAIPVQVIDDSSTPSPAPPSGCGGSNSSSGSSMSPCADANLYNCVNAFDANGILGVGTANQDCGGGCVGSGNADNGVYWSCPPSGSTGTCSSTDLALADQVANPVASFSTDNNGVIIQLASIPSTGATTGSGYLVFGIGTESNNALDGATVLTANEEGNFITEFNGQQLTGSFIDSGSNALYFNDSSLDGSMCGTSGGAAQFYCPASTTSLTATNQGESGATSDVSFQVANLNNISNSDFAIDDVAGTAPAIAGFPTYFDWGVPFFYGRTIFIAIEGMSAAGTTGPYYAY